MNVSTDLYVVLKRFGVILWPETAFIGPLTSTETIRPFRDGENWEKGVWRWGRGRVYTYRYTVTTRMTCIKMGSDESHFNGSLIVRGKVHKPQLLKTNQKSLSKKQIERRAEADSNRGPSVYKPNASPLGQTGSLI